MIAAVREPHSEGRKTPEKQEAYDNHGSRQLVDDEMPPPDYRQQLQPQGMFQTIRRGVARTFGAIMDGTLGRDEAEDEGRKKAKLKKTIGPEEGYEGMQPM